METNITDHISHGSYNIWLLSRETLKNAVRFPTGVTKSMKMTLLNTQYFLCLFLSVRLPAINKIRLNPT